MVTAAYTTHFKKCAPLDEAHAQKILGELWLVMVVLYLVYNNDMLTLPQLIQHFETVEQNPTVKNLPKKKAAEFNAITQMIAHFNCHPHGYWYIFWYDVHKMNQDVSGIKDNDSAFNPCFPTSICYRPMNRKETEEYLGGLKGGQQPLGRNRNLPDLLFGAMDETRKHPANTPCKTGTIVGIQAEEKMLL